MRESERERERDEPIVSSFTCYAPSFIKIEQVFGFQIFSFEWEIRVLL
jgi:hypothetical protein